MATRTQRALRKPNQGSLVCVDDPILTICGALGFI